MKYLLIDGNNFAIRNAFANEGLETSDGIPSGVHYGVFQSLIMVKKTYPEHQILFCWDGKSKRRGIETRAAVEKGMIKSAYKENRPKDDLPKPLRDFFEQSMYLKKGLEQAGIPQVRLKDFEADDVIATYCELLRDEHEIICVTNDKDYYQLLHENVSISKWSGGEETVITKASFTEQYGIEPLQHVEVGALMGDAGDNIFGIPSWGETTALKAIQQLGTWQNVLNQYKQDLNEFREVYPDLKDNPDEFNRLKDIKTPSGKDKYPEITINMPYTGVTLAVEDKRDKKVKTIKKNVLLALMHEERVELAYSLKKMDLDIPNIPDIPSENGSNESRLREYFEFFEIREIAEEAVGVLV